MRLKGKVAIVTGGNSGIGAKIVLALAEQGASVCIDYISHPEKAVEIEQEIVQLGDQALFVDGGLMHQSVGL
jgi:glucose 1-dehydrogenase